MIDAIDRPAQTCAKPCGGEIIHKAKEVDGVRQESWVCERCGLGLWWRRRVVKRRAPAPLAEFDDAVAQAASHVDIAKHSLTKAARACDSASKLAAVEALRDEARAFALRVAALLNNNTNGGKEK